MSPYGDLGNTTVHFSTGDIISIVVPNETLESSGLILSQGLMVTFRLAVVSVTNTTVASSFAAD